MPFLENVLKPLHNDALGELIHTQFISRLVCTPLPLSAEEGGKIDKIKSY